jgi:hypothetical protein
VPYCVSVVEIRGHLVPEEDTPGQRREESEGRRRGHGGREEEREGGDHLYAGMMYCAADSDRFDFSDKRCKIIFKTGFRRC